MTRLGPIALLALTACTLANAEEGVQEHTETHSGPAAPASATRVEVATLFPSEARIEISLPGEVEGYRDALLASSLGGQVERVNVREGEDVREGQLLVRIDAEIHGAQVDQAEARLALAESDLRRLETLGDLGTEADLERARTEAAVSSANLRIAHAQLDRARITAPFSGTVGSIDVEVGEFAAPGSPVVRLVQLDPVRVTLSVPDRDVVALAPGMDVSVTASARAATFHGTLTQVGTTADLRTRAFEVGVEVPNPDRQLLPGMIVHVTAARTVQDNALVIPQDWVVTTLDDQGVFLVENGRAVWRPVTLGALVRDQVVVTEGLSPGEAVVITGHRDLAPGDPLLVSRAGVCCSNGRAVFGQYGVAGGEAAP